MSLEGIQKELQHELHAAAIRWTKQEQLHLTLQFLGYIEELRLPEFENAIAHALKDWNGFELRSEHLGCFPSAKRPRILWAGLDGELSPLQQIKANLDKSLSCVGYVPEERPFHAHITLARIGEIRLREAKRLHEALGKYERQVFGTWRVQSIDFIQSSLSPAGARYQILRSFTLR